MQFVVAYDDTVLVELARLAHTAGTPLDRAEAVVTALAGAGLSAAVRWLMPDLRTLATAGELAGALAEPEPDALVEPVLAGEPFVCNELDALLTDHAAWRDGLLAGGLNAVAMLPLAPPPNGEPDGARGVAGLLVLGAPAPCQWRGESWPRLELLAQLTADGLGPAGQPAGPVGHESGPAPFEAALREAFVVLHLDRDVDQLCRRAVQQTRRVLGADYALVARADAAHQWFTCCLADEQFQLAAAEVPVLAQLVRAKERLTDLPASGLGTLWPALEAAGIAATLALPLDFQGENFGVLLLGFRDPGRLTPAVLDAAEELAFHTALSLRDAGLLLAQQAALGQLRQAQDELTQSAKFRALAQMAGGVAHEFNNALGGILARAQMLQRQTSDRAVLSGLTTIAEIGWRAAETVRRLQEFTRERDEDDFEDLSTETLWQALGAAIRQQVVAFSTQTGRRYVVDLEQGELRGAVRVNAAELTEAIGNVIVNALEATPGGGVVMVYADVVLEQFQLTIVDRGVGMAGDVLQSCLDPFFSTKAETGVGLGLSVTYGILSRHRGEVTVDSSPEQGTTVQLTLPLATATRTELRQAPHILIIDDEAALCEVLSELLGDAGYTTDSCAGGREGIERFQSTDYDLVCTDLRTEDLSGWEVIRAIKESGRPTPVLLLTGFRDQLRPEQIHDSGVDAVLGKPFTLQQVLGEVEKLLPSRPA